MRFYGDYTLCGDVFCGIKMQRILCLPVLFHSPARRCVNHLQKSVDIQNELEDDDMEDEDIEKMLDGKSGDLVADGSEEKVINNRIKYEDNKERVVDLEIDENNTCRLDLG